MRLGCTLELEAHSTAIRCFFTERWLWSWEQQGPCGAGTW